MPQKITMMIEFPYAITLFCIFVHTQLLDNSFVTRFAKGPDTRCDIARNCVRKGGHRWRGYQVM